MGMSQYCPSPGLRWHPWFSEKSSPSQSQLRLLRSVGKTGFCCSKTEGHEKERGRKRVVLDGEWGDGDWKSRVCWPCWLPRKTSRGRDFCWQHHHGPRHPNSSQGSSGSILPRLSKADKGGSGVLPSYLSYLGCCWDTCTICLCLVFLFSVQ